MRTYTWDEFFDSFWDWSDSTRKTRISYLENIGSGDEIVEAVLDIQDEKIRAQLIRKAIKLGAIFTSEDFMNLDGELPEEVYKQLAEYTGYDANDPYFDEDNMSWDDFYGAFEEWNKELLIKRINKLTDFGPSEEVKEAILLMPDLETDKLLYEKAVAAGVKFTDEDELEIGNWGDVYINNMPTDEDIKEFGKNIKNLCDEIDEAERQAKLQRKQERRAGVFGTILALLGALGSDTGHKHPGICTGNCATCPPHYGYRYGRWYYGKGHVYGCEFGGNKGDGSL